MKSHCRTAALALAALLLVFAIRQPVGEALAEEPDPDPELQADDAAEDEEPPVEEEPVDDPDDADEPEEAESGRR